MVRIINSYTQSDPLAKVISDLGNTMFGDTLTPELKRQKLGSMQREEYGIDWMAKQAGAGGVLDPNRAAEAAVLAGMKPEDLAMFQTYLAGNLRGPRDPLTTNAMAGAGKYGNSADAFDIDQGNAMLRNQQDNATSRANNAATNANAFNMNEADNARMWRQFIEEPKPALGVDGRPRFVQQGQMTQDGVAPIPTNEVQIDPVKRLQQYIDAAQAAGITDPAQQRVYALEQISKSKSRPMTVYGPDGQPIVEMGGDGTGGSVGPLTNANDTKTQADLLAMNQFDILADRTENVVRENPDSVGAQGNVRGALQSAGIMAGQFTSMFGTTNFDEAALRMKTEAIAAGVKPETLDTFSSYDPSLSQIGTLYKMMAFLGIRTIGGQSGNDASDRDFKNIMAILGEPNAWMTNAKDLLSKMKEVRWYVRMRKNETRAARGLPPLPENMAPGPGGGQQRTSTGVTWEIVE